MKMPWPPPPEGTAVESPEWKRWKEVYAAWHANVLDSWALDAFQPWPPPSTGSLPSVKRRKHDRHGN